jgi:hypothetical protein
MSMLAVFALAIGFADLARGVKIRAISQVVPVIVGTAIALLTVSLAALYSTADLAVLLVIIAVVIGWVVLGDKAQSEPEARIWAVSALAVLAVGVVLVVGSSGAVSPVGGSLADWLRWTAFPRLPNVAPDRAPGQVLLLAGIFMIQLATGNLLVRLTLNLGGATGLSEAKGESTTRLKGGRMIGPMERVFILGLGLAGEPTAAGIVIAAKGLIRWPELQALRETKAKPGIDAVTEYFLVGSFASWLVALASLAFVRLS